VNLESQPPSIPASAPGKSRWSRRVVGSILIIVGIFGGLFYFSGGIYHFATSPEIARHMKVDADIQGLNTQLKLYYSMNGFYPTTQQGLQPLLTFPNTSPTPHRRYQTFDRVPKDPWQHDYIYRCPGIKNPHSYDLFSAGPDGKPDTADDDWG
jgi:general secretion pathway protein G